MEINKEILEIVKKKRTYLHECDWSKMLVSGWTWTETTRRVG